MHGRQNRRAYRPCGLLCTILAGGLATLPVAVTAQSVTDTAEQTIRTPVVTRDARGAVQEAAAAFRRVLDARQIPRVLLDHAHAVAVFDDLVGAAFIVGGRGGDGVLVRRRDEGDWGAPVFLNMAGVSLGAQIGGSRTDAVLLFMEPSALDALAEGRLEFGTSFRAVAGPARAHAETLSTSTRDHVLVYAEEEGLFAGAAFTGARLSPDTELNREVYGTAAGSLLRASAPAPLGLQDLAEAIAAPVHRSESQ